MALTVAQMTDQLRAAGYNGPWDDASVAAAYKRTATVADLAANGFTAPTSAPVSTPTPVATNTNAGAVTVGQIKQTVLDAIGSGNAAAAAQAAAQFAQTFGLNQQQFAEGIRQYNQNFGLAQAGVTGTINGQPTEAARQFNSSQVEAARQFAATFGLNEAGVLGVINGQPTEAAREFNATTGLAALKQAADLHGDPFAQQRMLYGLTQGGYSPAIDAIAGRTSGIPAFGAAQGPSAANTANLGNIADQVAGFAGQGQGTFTAPGSQPTAGGAQRTSSLLAPYVPTPFSSPTSGVGAGGAGAGAAGGGAPGSYGTSSAPVFNAPGPNSPNDTAQGTLMPGTTSMFTDAAQNKSVAGPGTGSNTIRGTRGTNFVGWTPQGLAADVQFLEPKGKVVANIWDETTDQNVADNSAVVGAIKGNGSGWGGAYYVPMPNGGGRITFGGIAPTQLNPTHQYSIRLALPDEGGGVGKIMESPVPGSLIAGLPQLNAQGQTAGPGQPAIDPNFMPADTAYKQAMVAQNPSMGLAGYRDMLQRTRGYVWSPGESAAAASAAQLTVDPNFMAADTPYKQALAQQNPAMQQAGYRDMLQRTRGYVWSPDEAAAPAAAPAFSAPASSNALATPGAPNPMTAPGPGLEGVGAALNAFPSPNKVVAREFLGSDPGTQRFLLSGEAAKTGLDPDVIQSKIKATLPQFTSPSFGLGANI